MSTYGFLPIAGISLLVYILSYILTKTSYLKVSSHRRIWNLILLATFLVAGTLGVFMAFIYNFELDFDIPYTMLQVHVGFGIVWFIVALFHFLWHLNYFKKAIMGLFTKGEV